MYLQCTRLENWVLSPVYIGVDFVGPLPESSNRTGRYDMICVVIDLLTSMVHLVPTKQTYRATDIAELMFECVYKLHSVPERIVSDWDSLFTSKFWKRLHGLIGTQLRMSSAFHPQTDSATERANRTITQMIRQCVRPDQKDWVTKLPAVEFAINSARSSTTGFSPFQLNYGWSPSPIIWDSHDEFPGVRKFAEKMKMVIMSAHDSIIAARVVNTVQANKKHAIAEYKVGDLVYLSTRNISLPKGRACKLAPKFLGPFAITKVLKEGATYQLDLSEEVLKRGINPSFHATLLKPHVPSDDRRFPRRLPMQIPGFGDKSREWTVDAIVAHHGKGMNSEFQILWKAGDKTWAPYREIAHLIALDRYCELMGVENPHDLPASYTKRDYAENISVSATRVLGGSYKGESLGREGPYLSPMSHPFSDEEWADCVEYALRHACYCHEGRTHPGATPPHYPEYRRMVEGGYSSYPSNPYSAYYNPPVGQRPANAPGQISMPPEVLSSFFNAQYRVVELMIGRDGRCTVPAGPCPISLARDFRRPKPTRHARYPRGRENGHGRGRGAGRGRFGRGRPFQNGAREEQVAATNDVAMPDAAALFPDFFAIDGNAIAGPSSLTLSTPIRSVDSVSVIDTSPGSVTEQLASDVSDLTVAGVGVVEMNGPPVLEEGLEVDNELDFA